MIYLYHCNHKENKANKRAILEQFAPKQIFLEVPDKYSNNERFFSQDLEKFNAEEIKVSFDYIVCNNNIQFFGYDDFSIFYSEWVKYFKKIQNNEEIYYTLKDFFDLINEIISRIINNFREEKMIRYLEKKIEKRNNCLIFTGISHGVEVKEFLESKGFKFKNIYDDPYALSVINEIKENRRKINSVPNELKKKMDIILSTEIKRLLDKQEIKENMENSSYWNNFFRNVEKSISKCLQLL